MWSALEGAIAGTQSINLTPPLFSPLLTFQPTVVKAGETQAANRDVRAVLDLHAWLQRQRVVPGADGCCILCGTDFAEQNSTTTIKKRTAPGLVELVGTFGFAAVVAANKTNRREAAAAASMVTAERATLGAGCDAARG